MGLQTVQAYKYTKKEYLDAFFSRGTVQIGTLHWYRNTDALGTRAGDKSEGILPFHGKWVNAPDDALQGTALETVFSFNRAGNVTLANCAYMSPDMYVFSCSRSYSLRTHRKWRDDPQCGYDACYRLNDPAAFLNAVSLAIREQCTPYAFSPVIYTESPIDMTGVLRGVDPALLKPGITHGDQDELRALWRQNNAEQLAPYIRVDVPEAIQYCSVKAVIRAP